MKVFILIILLITCTSSDGLRCAITEDKQYFEKLLFRLNSDQVLEGIRGLRTEEYESNMCRIMFYISYSRDILIVQLTEHLQDRDLSDGYVRIDTYMRGANVFNVGAAHFIEYACSKDLCEIEFVEEYSQFLDWLIDAKYLELSRQLGTLIYGAGEDRGE